jgi:membrane associated rhomboid family serine protease
VIVILFSLALTVKGIRDPRFFELAALNPADPLRRHGVTLMTSIFLHAGFSHLLSNMYFLYICSDDIEEIKGARFTAGLFLISAFAGSSLYLFNGGSLPTVGSSGGVAGVMAYYALAFPHNRFRFLSRYNRRYNPTSYSVPAWAALFLFFITQVLNYFFAKNHLSHSHINNLAHLGGLAVGIFAFLLFEPKKP